MDIKQVLTSRKFTLPTTTIATFLLTLAICGRNPEEKFADRQDNAIHLSEGGRELNRNYFNPQSFKTVDWERMSDTEIAKLLGETSAKELAMDIDSINRRLATPGKLYGLDYNYCNKSVTNAIVDATKRMKFRENCFAGRPFAKKTGRSEALYNGDRLVAYFKSHNIPGAIIENPTQESFKHINPGAVVRYSGHTKMYIGTGFVGESGTIFVPDQSGKPVIASGYNERFSYFDGAECTVVDIAKVVEHNLRQAGRNR